MAVHYPDILLHSGRWIHKKEGAVATKIYRSIIFIIRSYAITHFRGKRISKSSHKIRNFHEPAPERCYDSCLSDACTPHGECSPDRRQLFRGLLCCAYMVAWTERSRREDCLRCVLQCFKCKDASSSAARLIHVCESDHLAQLKSHRLVAFYWTDIFCEVFSRQKRHETYFPAQVLKFSHFARKDFEICFTKMCQVKDSDNENNAPKIFCYNSPLIFTWS